MYARLHICYSGETCNDFYYTFSQTNFNTVLLNIWHDWKCLPGQSSGNILVPRVPMAGIAIGLRSYNRLLTLTKTNPQILNICTCYLIIYNFLPFFYIPPSIVMIQNRHTFRRSFGTFQILMKNNTKFYIRHHPHIGMRQN